MKENLFYQSIFLHPLTEFAMNFFKLRKTGLNVLNRKKDTVKHDLMYECNNCMCSFNQYGF